MAQGTTARAWARGGTILAATVMLIIGVYQILMGLAAILSDPVFVLTAPPNSYTYHLATKSWGWIHLGVGIVVFLAGLGLFSGRAWARAIAIAVAAISLVANFFLLPFFPLWSLVIIALDIFVLWAVTTAPRRDRMEEEQRAMAGAGYGYSDTMQPAERWATTNPQGRHWAPEPAKETGRAEQMPREEAEAMARRARSRRQEPPQGGGQGPMPPNG